MGEAKPFLIPKREVWEAFKRVKTNQGAACVDEQAIEDSEANLSGNLYKLWNRISSVSYFPPPVRRVDIAESKWWHQVVGYSNGRRPHCSGSCSPISGADLGAGVSSRLLWSFGYRPGKSAIDAVAKAHERCWRYDWVLDARRLPNVHRDAI